MATGTEADKCAFLRSRAYADYLVARAFPAPEPFHLHVVGPDGSRSIHPVAHAKAVAASPGLDHLFFDALEKLNQDLPTPTRLKIPEDPLLLVRALTIDALGEIVPTDSLRNS